MLKRKSKRVLSIVLAVAMIAGLFPIAAFADEGTAARTTIYVDASATNDDGTDGTYKTLAAAVNAANAGATIELKSDLTIGEGPSNNIVVDKAITIDGKNFSITKSFNTTGNADGYGDYEAVFQITSTEGVTIKNVKIAGLEGGNKDEAGIYIKTGATATIQDCTFQGSAKDDNKYGCAGIITEGNSSNGLTVSDCIFKNVKYAMYFNGISGATITNNNVDTTSYTGIYIADQSAFDVTVSNNTMTNVAVASEGYDKSYGSGVYVATPEAKKITVANNNITMADTATGEAVGNVNVAQIGDKQYKTLQGAVTAADTNAATINLISDITLDSSVMLSSNQNITINGSGHTISYDGIAPASKVAFKITGTASEMEGTPKNVSLNINNVNFKNTNSTQGGYAVLIGGNSNNTTVALRQCSFNNLYCGILGNAFTQTEKVNEAPDFSITDSTFTDTEYGYSVDTTTPGALVNASNITFEGNTGNVTEQETFTTVEAYVTRNGMTTVATSFADALANVQDGDIIDLQKDISGDVTISKGVKNLTIRSTNGSAIQNGTLKVVMNGIQLPGLTIEGLSFENANIQMSPNGTSDLSNMTIRNNTFTGTMPNNHSAIHLNLGSKDADGTGAAFDGLTITGNTIKDIKSGNNSGILIIGDGTSASDVTITNNTIDGVGWNGIQLSRVAGDVISVTRNDIRNCGATDPDGVLNLYNSKANSFKINENKIIVGENQLGVSNISDDVDLNRNYWGAPNPDFDSLLGYTDGTAAVEVDEFYRAETMRAEDLNTYEPPYTGKYSHEIFTKVGENGTISVDRYATEGDDVTITVSPDEAYLLDELTVTAGGKEVEVKDNGDGTYTFKMPSADAKIVVTFAEDPDWEPEPEEPAMPFTDVNENDWFYDVVLYAYDNGLMTGVSATEFAPNQTTTRGMIVSMLARLEGVTSAEDAGFADVAANDWYATAVNWAASVGVVNGYEDDTFRPNAPITREQMAAILYNYADYKGYDVSARADLSDYADAASISSWAEDVLAWANAEGLINGMTATTIDPQGATTRAQTAAMFERFLTAHEA